MTSYKHGGLKLSKIRCAQCTDLGCVRVGVAVGQLPGLVSIVDLLEVVGIRRQKLDVLLLSVADECEKSYRYGVSFGTA
jgi:hypothetical protein